MYKVLIHGMTPFHGGIESFLMNYYRKLNDVDIHFDFLSNAPNPYYEKEILENKSKIFYVGLRREAPIKYKKNLEEFFKNHASDYDCFWDNESTLANLDYLKLAKKYGIKRRIIHSHNSDHPNNNYVDKILSILHFLNKKRIKKYATDYWACSQEAADFFYPFSDNVKIIKNAINESNFFYDNKKRREIRNKFKMDGYFIIGNVGRLTYQKNQEFAIKILNELIKDHVKVKMVFVGDGEDKYRLLNLATSLNLEKNIIFAGNQNDMEAWYSAFDLFLFPSRFEGLGIVLLEAQANGLPILSSINIKDEMLNSNYYYLDLNKSEKIWSKEIETLRMDTSLRIKDKNMLRNIFIEHGYDIDKEAESLKDYFIENK